MSLFHTHKFGPVQGDNFQYCSVCGVAHVAPSPCKNGHKFVTHDTTEIVNMYGKTQRVITLSCERCGVFRSFNSTTGQYRD